jgi:serine/threonine protein phosphatase 1
MLNWLRRPRRRVLPAEKAVPDDTVVWSIGDIHGRADLLRVLLAAILDDLRKSRCARKVIVFLGDYVDRGPDSREVLDLLCRLEGRGIETHFLRGNHEERMEAVLGDPALAPGWCDYGGRETLRSYGVSPPQARGDEAGWAEAVEQLNQNLPEAHRWFLTEQASSVVIGDFFFAHAGARPGVPLDQQSVHDLMWIRRDFLDDAKPFEQIVVHGHTPTEAVHSDARRIGLDTGAYATGVLTALRLEGADRRLLQTRVSGGSISLEQKLA